MADLISGTIKNLLGQLTEVAYDEISSAWGVKTDLQKLKATLLTIQAVLLDAEEQQAHSRVLRDWLHKLKNVCYDIEDVLDLFEVETLTKQVITTHGSFQKKVHRFFSSSNTVVVSFKLARRIKNIRKDLDEIALDKSQFHLREIAGNQRPVVLRGKETHSFVEPNEVIGRDEHKQTIVKNLLSLSDNERRQQSSKNTRHLAISDIGILETKRNILSMLGYVNNIRTFICPKLGSETFFNMCLLKCKSLRVLNLESSSLKVLPYSIGTLKQLRFLNLSESKRIKKLPNSLCKLHSLQFLNLTGCSELEELPKDMKYMISLRVLALTTKQKSLSETGIECLKSLRTLDLEDCKNLEYLFAGMECPPALETLAIHNSPMLISLPRALKCLTSFKILHIENCQELDLGMKFESEDVNIMLSLQRLGIKHLPKLIYLPSWLLGGTLKSLEVIHLIDCENLTELPESLPSFTSLKELYIITCPSLKTLPRGMKRLTSLKKLSFSYCENLNLTVEEENDEDQPSESKLEKLAIGGFPKLTTLPKWLLQWSMLSLETLWIIDCHQLKTLPAIIQSLTSLKSLYIIDCPLLIESCKTGEDFHRTAHVEKRIISNTYQLESFGRKSDDFAPLGAATITIEYACLAL
ncbi:hypothetical protein ACFE04_013562 [Oxalis oulophora]